MKKIRKNQDSPEKIQHPLGLHLIVILLILELVQSGICQVVAIKTGHFFLESLKSVINTNASFSFI